MKKTLFLIIIIASVFFAVSCDGKSSPVNPISNTGLTYLGAIGGVCNNALSKTRGSQDAPVTIYATKDSIRVVATVNYTCGAPLETSCNITGKSVKMYIKDVCSDTSNCYQRCKCDYPFEFLFERKGNVDYDYSVLLESHGNNQPVILSEGVLRTKI